MPAGVPLTAMNSWHPRGGLRLQACQDSKDFQEASRGSSHAHPDAKPVLRTLIPSSSCLAIQGAPPGIRTPDPLLRSYPGLSAVLHD